MNDCRHETYTRVDGRLVCLACGLAGHTKVIRETSVRIDEWGTRWLETAVVEPKLHNCAHLTRHRCRNAQGHVVLKCDGCGSVRRLGHSEESSAWISDTPLVRDDSVHMTDIYTFLHEFQQDKRKLGKL